MKATNLLFFLQISFCFYSMSAMEWNGINYIDNDTYEQLYRAYEQCDVYQLKEVVKKANLPRSTSLIFHLKAMEEENIVLLNYIIDADNKENEAIGNFSRIERINQSSRELIFSLLNRQEDQFPSCMEALSPHMDEDGNAFDMIIGAIKYGFINVYTYCLQHEALLKHFETPTGQYCITNTLLPCLTEAYCTGAGRIICAIVKHSLKEQFYVFHDLLTAQNLVWFWLIGIEYNDYELLTVLLNDKMLLKRIGKEYAPKEPFDIEKQENVILAWLLEDGPLACVVVESIAKRASIPLLESLFQQEKFNQQEKSYLFYILTTIMNCVKSQNKQDVVAWLTKHEFVVEICGNVS